MAVAQAASIAFGSLEKYKKDRNFIKSIDQKLADGKELTNEERLVAVGLIAENSDEFKSRSGKTIDDKLKFDIACKLADSKKLTSFESSVVRFCVIMGLIDIDNYK